MQSKAGLFEDVEKARIYWERQLEGFEDGELFVVPIGREPSRVRARYEAAIGRELTDRLLKIGKNNHMALYVLLLAGWKALLYKCSGRRDLVVASPVYGGSSFNSFVPLRTRLNPDQSWRELVLALRETLQDGYKNQHYPLEKIAGAPAGADWRSPFTRTLVALAPLHLPEAEWAAQGPDCDLAVWWKLGGEELSVALDYRTAAVPEGFAPDLMKAYERLLGWMTGHMEARIADDWTGAWAGADDPGASPAPAASLVKLPAAETYHQLFERQALQTPYRTAIRHGSRSITYLELHNRSVRFAGTLRDNGVAKGDAVAVLLDASVEWMIGILGVLRAGGVYVPVEPAHPAERLRDILRDCGASCIICDGSLDERIAFSGPVIRMDEASGTAEGRSGPPQASHPGDAAGIVYMSGADGAPAGAVYEHRSATAQLRVARECLILKETDSVLLCVSSVSDFLRGAWMTLFAGAELHLLNSGELYAKTREERSALTGRTTVLMADPLYADELDLQEVPQLTKLVLAGRMPGERQLAEWRKRTECLVVYGPPEAPAYAASRRTGPGSSKDGVTAPWLIGSAAPGSVLSIADPDGRPQAPGLPGELCIAGAGLSRSSRSGLQQAAEGLAECLGGGPFFRTGARARGFPGGGIQLMGRVDRQVELNGIWVEPSEIERRLRELTGAAEAVIVSRLDESGSGSLIAYYAPGGPSDPKELKGRLASLLPYELIPHHFVPLPKLPVTRSGRTDTGALPPPQEEEDREDMTGLFQGGIEEDIAAVWKRLTGLERISATRSFLEMGGNSILLLKLIAELHRLYPGTVNAADVFTYSSVRQLAERIASIRGTKTAPKRVDPAELSVRLPLEYFTEGGGTAGESAMMSLTLPPRLSAELIRIAGQYGVGARSVLAASCLHLLSLVGGQTKVQLQTALDGSGRFLPVTAELDRIKDYPALLRETDQAVRGEGPGASYALEDWGRAEGGLPAGMAVALLYDSALCSFRQEWTGYFDLLLGISLAEESVRLAFRYNGARLHARMAKDWFRQLLDYVEELADQL